MEASATPLHLQTTQPYNAYDGEELLLWIMKRIHDELRRYGTFSKALTYERANVEFTMKLESYALEDRIISGKHSIQPKPPVTETMTASTKPPAPDDVRRALGLPVPTPQLSTGGMVDVTLAQQQGK